MDTEVLFIVEIVVKGVGTSESIPLPFKAAQALAKELAAKNKAATRVRRVSV